MTLALALGSGNFYPADKADEKRAMEIAEDTGEDDLDDDLASDENAPPIEGKTETRQSANTPSGRPPSKPCASFPTCTR